MKTQKQVIISIGREFGSAGHEIAERIAKRYGLSLYDHNLLREVADSHNVNPEELEIFDLLIAGKKVTKDEEQKVKLSAKNLYKKLVDNRNNLLVVDWYKDEQPIAKLKYEVELSLNDDLPESYDKVSFDSKVSLLMNHFMDMAVQGYGWVGSV